MADLKISQLTGASTPLAGTEVLPIVQSGSTVKVSVADLTAGRTVAMSRAVLGADFGGNISIYEPTAATAKINVFANGAQTALVSLAGNANTLGTTSLDLFQDGGSAAYLYNRANSALNFGTNNTNRGSFSATGDFNVDSGNIIPATAAKGVNFTANTPAAGMTSQLLNWYEEGTWTPTLTGLTVVGTPTYTGTYTRTGRLVFIRVTIASTTSTASTSGTTTITNLPYSSSGASVCYAADGANAAGYGTGFMAAGTIYTPTWPASSSVAVTATYTV